jgi:REP element-mobilizing transposase RayT
MKNTKSHACNLRKFRVSESGRIYLITCVTDQRQPVFSQWNYGRLLVRVLMKEQHRAETLAYVIMPDHLHWLTQLKDGVMLGELMCTVKCVSSWQINRQLNRSGKLWQPGYHDHALREEEDLVTTARYLIANPLRAGLVKRIGDYPLWDAAWL